MKMYPTGVVLFCSDSGRIRTAVSANTAKKTMRRLQRMFPDNEHISDFTTDQLTKFCLAGKNPAPSTIKQRRAWCRTMFEWWCYKGYCKSPEGISHNPASDLKFTVVTGTGTRRVNTWLSQEQIRQAYNAFDASNPIEQRNRLMFLCGVMTGLRASELAALRWDDFEAGFTALKSLRKGDKQSRVEVPPQLQRELQAWHQRRPVGAQAVFPSFKYIWDPQTNRRASTAFWDRPVTDAVVTTMCRDVSEKLGVKVRPHDMRRTFADLFNEQARLAGDVDPLRATQEALGHSHAVTTQRYLSKNPARVKAVMDRFALDLGA